MLEKVKQTADAVELGELLGHSPAELSGGQKQRVSMAGVMIDDVDILLFDEPLANLDPATGKRAITLIDEIQKKQNTTIIIIEHRLEDALYKDVDRIIVVGDGQIAADMTPDELLCGSTLTEQGIREPLYISALKLAGCTIRPDDCPGHVETMNLNPYRETVRRWYDAISAEASGADTEEILSLSHVDFSYRKDEPVLKDISFSVKKGEMLSIVAREKPPCPI
jgi:energy-coupling factor transport system ATP-binding protein